LDIYHNMIEELVKLSEHATKTTFDKVNEVLPKLALIDNKILVITKKELANILMTKHPLKVLKKNKVRFRVARMKTKDNKRLYVVLIDLSSIKQ